MIATTAREKPMGDRLLEWSTPVTETGCWLWLGASDNRQFPFLPYGQIWFRGRTLRAHRISYEHFVGVIPKGMLVLHKCDVPLCINPDHLFLGTHRDNTMDMIRKGRFEKVLEMFHRGENSHYSKLKNAQVLAIRDDPRIQNVIARDYDICQKMVSNIKRRKAWRHI